MIEQRIHITYVAYGYEFTFAFQSAHTFDEHIPIRRAATSIL